ncbi:MAG: cysteine-rich small domain-containing protein [Clostridioides sp.]|jgi:Zn-finger protein|nr:cysteine-rich small domain-containing protein [Clostridioides sp.]
MSANFKFFNHKDCEYFPCHKTDKPDEFNCLFCYCPLYALGKNCGGNFKIIGEGIIDNPIKDCSECKLPHVKENYDYIMSKYDDIVKIANKNL